MDAVPVLDELFTDPWFENSVPIVIEVKVQAESPYARPLATREENVPLAKP